MLTDAPTPCLGTPLVPLKWRAGGLAGWQAGGLAGRRAGGLAGSDSRFTSLSQNLDKFDGSGTYLSKELRQVGGSGANSAKDLRQFSGSGANLAKDFREMGGAPRNLAPRNHFLVWTVKPSGCHCTDGHLTGRVFTEDQQIV